MTGSSGTLGSGATGTISAPSHPAGGGVAMETGTGSASGNAMAAQYLQAMMQQNGFASFSFPFNGPPGQVNIVFKHSSMYFVSDILTYGCKRVFLR